MNVPRRLAVLVAVMVFAGGLAMPARAATSTIGILVYDGFLTSDVTAPVEVFGAASKKAWFRVAVRQGALYQDGRVVAERRLRLGRSLYQRAENLKSLSPPPIVGVDTRRWGRLLVGPIVSSL